MPLKVLPSDPKQALRCRRVLMASAAYLLWMLVAGYLYAAGLLRIGGRALPVYYGLIILTNTAVFLFVRLGFNQRFSDPSLTFPQIMISIVWAMALVTFVVPEARGLMLLLFASAFFFGVFRLKTFQFIVLAIFAVSLYGALLVWESDILTRAQLQVEIAQLVVLGAVLFWMSFMGGYVARLRSELRGAMRQIETLAHTDDLTGTENRRSITSALHDAIEGAADSHMKLAVCLLDMDGFKQINDEYGHLAGDGVLRGFVERVQGELRDQDMVGRGLWPGALGRFGGEEFLVVLRGTDEGGARHAAERIRQAVAAAPFETEVGAVAATVSAGVAGWRPGEDPVQLLRRADRALYRAKEQGRDRVCAHSREH